jgi:hypothetical protein
MITKLRIIKPISRSARSGSSESTKGLVPKILFQNRKQNLHNLAEQMSG